MKYPRLRVEESYYEMITMSRSMLVDDDDDDDDDNSDNTNGDVIMK